MYTFHEEQYRAVTLSGSKGSLVGFRMNVATLPCAECVLRAEICRASLWLKSLFCFVAKHGERPVRSGMTTDILSFPGTEASACFFGNQMQERGK